MMRNDAFKKLSHKQELKFRAWARNNYHVGAFIDPIWHPVVQDECKKMNTEAHEQLMSELSSIERQLSLTLQSGTTVPNKLRLIDDARSTLRNIMRKMGFQGQF